MWIFDQKILEVAITVAWIDQKGQTLKTIIRSEGLTLRVYGKSNSGFEKWWKR